MVRLWYCQLKPPVKPPAREKSSGCICFPVRNKTRETTKLSNKCPVSFGTTVFLKLVHILIVKEKIYFGFFLLYDNNPVNVKTTELYVT